MLLSTFKPIANLHSTMEQEVADLQEGLAQEQKRREAAEADAQLFQSKTLVEYLDACHKFFPTHEVATEGTVSTQADTEPVRRAFPRRIIPWDDFTAQQNKIWRQLSASDPFLLQRVYPSTDRLQYVQK